MKKKTFQSRHTRREFPMSYWAFESKEVSGRVILDWKKLPGLKKEEKVILPSFNSKWPLQKNEEQINYHFLKLAICYLKSD